MSQAPRVAVVGHVEWVDFALVEHVPAAGEIVTATEHFALAAGGGAVAAVQLRKLAGAAAFLTALGDDAHGERAAAARAARAARVLVASARAPEPLLAAGVTPDVLIASARDAKERATAAAFDSPARLLVLTDGAHGGRWKGADGSSGTWPAAPLPGPPVDAYGCGDSFAAGLTYALATTTSLEAALTLAARCGAHCLTGHGPYTAQLDRAD